MDLLEYVNTDVPRAEQPVVPQMLLLVPPLLVALLVTVTSVTVLVFILVTCVCWPRQSSGTFSSRSETVLLDELLSKPSLAEPDSVFSEAGSCHFSLEERKGSFDVPPGDDSCCFRESSSTSSYGGVDSRNHARPNGDESSNVLDVHTISSAPKTYNYQKGHSIRPTQHQQQQQQQQDELAQIQLQNRENIHKEATVSRSNRYLRSTIGSGDTNDKSASVSASVSFDGGSPKTTSHTNISDKVGLDSTALKIHRDSLTGNQAPFLSSVRCSFSHEVDHIVHGNKTPRPSLPRTDELVESQATPPSASNNNSNNNKNNNHVGHSQRPAELSVDIQTGDSSVSCSHNIFPNSRGHNTSPDGLARNDKVGNSHQSIVAYPVVNCPGVEQHVHLVADPTKVADVTDSLTKVAPPSHSQHQVKDKVSTDKPISDLGLTSSRVSMRRCMSCVQDDTVCPDQTRTARRQTFSLNLKIDVHFDSDRNCSENLPTVVCSPYTGYTKCHTDTATGATQEHCSCDSFSSHTSDCPTVDRVLTGSKHRPVTTSSADTSQQTNTHKLDIARKRCSEPTIVETSRVTTGSAAQLSRRYSQVEFLALSNQRAAVKKTGHGVAATNDKSESVNLSTREMVAAMATAADRAVKNSSITTDTTPSKAAVEKSEEETTGKCVHSKVLSVSTTDSDQAVPDDDVSIARVLISVCGDSPPASNCHVCDVAHIPQKIEPEPFMSDNLDNLTVTGDNCGDEWNCSRALLNDEKNKQAVVVDTNDHHKLAATAPCWSHVSNTHTAVSGEGNFHPSSTDTDLSPVDNSHCQDTDVLMENECTSDYDVGQDFGQWDPHLFITTQQLLPPERVNKVTTGREIHFGINFGDDSAAIHKDESVATRGRSQVKQLSDASTNRHDLHRRALTVKEGHARTAVHRDHMMNAQFQRTSSLKMNSVEERVQNSSSKSEITKQRRQAGFFADLANLATKKTDGTHGEAKFSPGAQHTDSVGVSRLDGHNTSVLTVDQMNFNNKHTIQSDVTTDKDKIQPDVTTDKDKIQSGVATNKDKIQSSVTRPTRASLPDGSSQKVTTSAARKLDKNLFAETARQERADGEPYQWRQDQANNLLCMSTHTEDHPPERIQSTSSSIKCNLIPNQDRKLTSDNDNRGLASMVTISVEDSSDSTQTAEVSDDSDYDNPWDSLDEAVKRASIRYNRRPSRIAAGDDKRLLLKSAEDLGRLLEEADKRRQLRQTRNSYQVVSPQMESMTVPLTRLTPHRHTTKDIVCHQSALTVTHSTEDILTPESRGYSRLGVLQLGDDLDHSHKRPMSLAAKTTRQVASQETTRKDKI